MNSIKNITYHTLPSGLRIVHQQSKSHVEYCGVAINVGSRDEVTGQYGLAHFVEHTIFKGTKRRKSWHIINRMEAIGGELNAYTTKEETILYSVFPYGNVSRAIELISDLVVNSQFPTNEINKEREVVADEINSYLDSPSEAVYDDFEDLMFANSSLGHNILGTVEAISGFTQDVCREYLTNFYTADNMVLFYMGKARPERVFALAEKYFQEIGCEGKKRQREMPIIQSQFDKIQNIGSHQSHTIIGARVPGLYSDMRYPIALFANMLGGPGMNSMLNVALRERRGLVYNVETSTAMFTDAGAMMIYFGCDPEDLAKCRRVVRQTIDGIIEKGLSARVVDAAKKQYLGQLAVASDNREQVALSIGRSMMYYGEVFSSEKIKEQILSITPDDVRKVAELLGPEKCSILTME